MKRLVMTVALAALLCAGIALAGGHSDRVYEQSRAEWTPVAYPDGSRLDLIFESFEDGVPPAGWSIMTSGESSTWEQSGNWAHSGQYSALVAYGEVGVQDEWLVTPALSTIGLTALLLEFFEQEEFWTFGMAHYVMVSTTVPDDPAAFSVVLEMTPDNHNINPAVPVTVTLNDYIGYDTVYVALRYVGEFADNWWVDDFYIYEPPEHDVMAIDVVPDGEIWLAGDEITPQFTIENIGSNAETFEAELDILYNGAPFYTEYVTVDGLGSGEEITVDFPSFICEIGAYSLTGTAVLVEDEDPTNNVATASNGCYSQGRTPFGILYTNWNCGPCVAANQAMDEWYPTQGNEACVIRVHVWWPGNDDPMYQANIPQNTFLHGAAAVDVWGVPCLLCDNTEPSTLDVMYGTWMETVPTYFGISADTPSPLEMEINYDQGANVAHVAVNVIEPMANGDYVVYVAITEDGIEAEGTNGEPVHNQAFRWLFPDEDGTPLVNELGIQEFMIPVDLSEDWVYENLRATTWVQMIYADQEMQGPILNSATMFLSEGSTGTAVGDDTGLPRLTTRLDGAHPNPFNPMTTISFTLAREQQVKLSVFNMAGKRVAELANGLFAAGDHPVIWNGQDLHGREVASGTYMIYMESEDQVRSSKMMLVR